MIEHVWTVVSSNTSIDSETNSISLFNVLEQITVFTDDSNPITIPIHFEIMSLWTRDKEDEPSQGKMRVFFCDPNDECVTHTNMEIDLRKFNLYRSRIKSDGMNLKGPGRYKFVIELNQGEDSVWEKVATVPIMIIYQPLKKNE